MPYKIQPSLGLRGVELKNITAPACFYTDFRAPGRLALKRLVVLHRGSSHLTVTVGTESVKLTHVQILCCVFFQRIPSA